LPGYSQIEHGKVKPNSTITIGRNKITFGKSTPVSIEGTTLDLFPNPEYLNGNKIYRVNDKKINSVPKFLNARSSFPLFIFKSIQEELNKLEDGTYGFSIEDVVINKNGEVVYYDYSVLRKLSNSYKEIHSAADLKNIKIDTNQPDDHTAVPTEKTKAIFEKLSAAMFNSKFSAASLANGETINCDLVGLKYVLDGFIVVKNHAAIYRPLTPGKPSEVKIEDQLQMPQY